mgnify:CR=1 FL=1
MKVVILAGGLGTRISEYTKTIPKPMIQIKGKPLIYYIMKHYAKYGYTDFIIASGYKHNYIKNFFANKSFGWKIKVVNTGINSMTGEATTDNSDAPIRILLVHPSDIR